MPITNTPPPAKAKTASARVSKKGSERREAVEGLFQLGEAGLILAGQHADAEAVSLHGPKIASELAALAENNKAIGDLIDKLTEVGPYAGIVAACMPLVLQLLVNHNRAKPGVMGTVSPKLLEAQSQSRIKAAEAAIQLEIDEQRRQAEKINAMREQNVADDIRA